MLYLPYGWWHQISSVGESVSVSYRWNPWTAALDEASRTEKGLIGSGGSSAPLQMVKLLVQRALASVPPAVSMLEVHRLEETAAVAHRGTGN
jgi:hypothetical protein